MLCERCGEMFRAKTFEKHVVKCKKKEWRIYFCYKCKKKCGYTKKDLRIHLLDCGKIQIRKIYQVLDWKKKKFYNNDLYLYSETDLSIMLWDGGKNTI